MTWRDAGLTSEGIWRVSNATYVTQRLARHIGVDRRTVHRKLKAEGYTFETLLREVRVELARAYLQAGDRQMKDISDLPGFSSPSAFSRWRWQNLGNPDAPVEPQIN